MSYIHYARIGDIWKHLPLCNFLSNEKPRFYFETNSALPSYNLSHSPERDYGIYKIIENVEKSNAILNSTFYRTLVKYNKTPQLTKYLGSPGFAFNILNNSVEQYIFCDIEDESIDSIERYANELNLLNKVRTYKDDSIHTFYSLIENMNSEYFIHIDPYSIFDENREGKSFFDVFIDSIGKGIKTMLWYGFDTNSQRGEYHKRMAQKLKRVKYKSGDIVSIELFLHSIKETEILINPGVVGCGVMIGNMSKKSIAELDIFSDDLITLYQDSIIEGNFSGKLDKTKFLL